MLSRNNLINHHILKEYRIKLQSYRHHGHLTLVKKILSNLQILLIREREQLREGVHQHLLMVDSGSNDISENYLITFIYEVVFLKHNII
jgi:hypothetical protein